MPRPRTRALAALEPETVKLDGISTYEERMKVEAAARGIAAITSYTPRSPASTELAKERDSAQESASQTDSTPIKSGGATDLSIDKLTRPHIETHLAEEIHARRSKSADLVESLFGSFVDVDDAAAILHEFLAMSILSVQKEIDGELKDVMKKDYKAACADAAIQAQEKVTPSKPSPADPYRWKWGLAVEASETAAALFLNVVAIAAHAAAIRSGQAQDHPLPSLRFVALPKPQQAVPLSNEAAAQDCRPDIMAFDCSAFCEAPNLNAPANRFLLKGSPFEYIRKNFPTILNFTPAHRSARGPAIAAFEHWFEEQERHNYLDMSRFCWPEIQLTGEAKLSDLHNAILQELVYMRQQRRTQPWMRSIVGLVVTTKIIGLLRADTLGIEQCTFNRDCSRGVLDSVRICLGLIRSNCLQRGQHEAFELFDTKTLAPPYLKSKPRPSKTRPSKTAVHSDLDVFAAEDPVVEYIHRTVRFIKLRGDRIHHSCDNSKPDVSYYVHHLVQDNGSLVGRCPRIFCVSRETESEGAVRRFVGPYALKVYYADHASECYRDDLINVARNAQVKNVLLPTWEWHYGDALSMRGFPLDVVQKYADAQAAAVVPSVISNREEIFAQSDLKRLLVQCSGYDEFGKAFINFAEGIASLAEQDLVHRDLSIGNVLLSQDTPCPSEFLSDAAASAEALIGTPVVFAQRALEQRMGGLIHDMDMAGRVHRLPEKAPTGFKSNTNLLVTLINTPGQPEGPAQPVRPQKGFRTGTPPFMAIGNLVDGPPHLVAYDLHSLLFVMVLFYWSHPTFLSDIHFPQSVPARSRTWPREVLRWANRPVDFTLAELGVLKRVFFSKPNILQETFQRTLGGDLWTENPVYLNLFWALYAALWVPSAQSKEWLDRRDVTPAEVEAALTLQSIN
ncbi:Other/FunK1 protein kinase [Mycena venus]|uniref:Other/FunK1 protein kinase n=1 Tax=Mycena venus TaxID=2733690 RepID=A0A8H6TYW5_9AGAR|nr:Other/FunK1 protein kinase [Mycena venus]